MHSTYDVAVIGAGAFGAWTAWHLARARQKVLLLDAWGPAHSRASSGGESRIIRMGYGADAIYTRMSRRSLALWQHVLSQTGERLFHPTGVLWMAREGEPYSLATEKTLAAEDVPAEILRGAELAQRYPQMHLDDARVYGILEPASGVLMARRAVAAVVDCAVRAGAVYRTEAVTAPSPAGEILTLAGEPIRAASLVYACGPWLPKIFPELLGRRIYPTRQEILFFAPPAGDGRFRPPALPAWVDFIDPRGPYGCPDLEGRGLKVGFDQHGEAFDPDTGDRRVSAEGVEAARRFLAERFPAMAHAPLVESRVCQYENSSNGDFLLDRHPDLPHVWLAGGGSGHGFKHGPGAGEYLCSQILVTAPAEPRFSLSSKPQTQQRSVY